MYVHVLSRKNTCLYVLTNCCFWFHVNRNVNPFNNYQMVYHVSLHRDSYVLLRGHKLKKHQKQHLLQKSNKKTHGERKLSNIY